MLVSLHWLNTYLDRPIDAAELDTVLTGVGFPIESAEPVGLEGGGSDTCVDVEVTSNRPDVLSHLGVAREVAAATDRTLVHPEAAQPPDDTSWPDAVGVEIADGCESACRLYTARVVRGVTVGPSPAWLRDRLEAAGQRSVNNIVDVTNYVLLETGQPLHGFDLDKLAGSSVVVRESVKDEAFAALDGTTHKLPAGVLVIADRDGPQAVAGVMGGAESGVTEGTTDVLLEAAVFDPLRVRGASRGLKLRSESSYRFERGVDDGSIAAVSARAVALIREVAGGEADGGLKVAGGPPSGDRGSVTLRTSRCTALLGVEVSADDAAGYLKRLGFVVSVGDGGATLTASVPSWRLDIIREVDLIEEVARSYGMDRLPVRDAVSVAVRPPTPEERARRAAAGVLVGHGYHETITPSFVTAEQAGLGNTVGAADGTSLWRSGRADSVLRPTVLLSLLLCRKANQDAGNAGVRLWELASAWTSDVEGGKADERRVLAWLADVGGNGKAEAVGEALRGVRGVVSELIESLGGTDAVDRLDIRPAEGGLYRIGVEVCLDTHVIGHYGVVADTLNQPIGVKAAVLGGELDWSALSAMYPPTRAVGGLARFPGIERDLSVVVAESTAWSSIASAVYGVGADHLAGLEYLGVYRGKQAGPGKKSVSLRLVFRDAGRTLTHDEIDPQASAIVEALTASLGAELRS